jgi:hypothetical protein
MSECGRVPAHRAHTGLCKLLSAKIFLAVLNLAMCEITWMVRRQVWRVFKKWQQRRGLLVFKDSLCHVISERGSAPGRYTTEGRGLLVFEDSLSGAVLRGDMLRNCGALYYFAAISPRAPSRPPASAGALSEKAWSCLVSPGSKGDNAAALCNSVQAAASAVKPCILLISRGFANSLRSNKGLEA